MEIYIKPKNNISLFNIKELWEYRELFFIFVWRDIKVRYKQTILGILWVIFQPLISMVIFTIFFGKIAQIPSGNLPYPLFVFTGLVFWTYFSNSVSHAASSMVDNESIIKKVYFPKAILPLAAILTGLIDFGINLFMLILISMSFGIIPHYNLILVLPLVIFLMMLTASGAGLFLSAVNVKYRDVRYILPFFISILLFLTPVIYSLDNLSLTNKYLMAINPMTAVIESVRAAYSKTYLDLLVIIISTLTSVTIFFTGAYYFNKTEQFFADIV